jgi:hypothetical protein
MYTGEQLHPSDKFVVRHGERYFNIMEQVVDTHPEWNESMKEAEKELKNPVKNFDKLKTLYDKVKKAEDEEKRKLLLHSRPHPEIPRSFTDSRIPMPFSHIPKVLMYRKPYDGDDDSVYRTPAKTRREVEDNGEDDNVLLQSREEKKPTSRLFNSPSSSMWFAPTVLETNPNLVPRRFDFRRDGDRK